MVVTAITARRILPNLAVALPGNQLSQNARIKEAHRLGRSDAPCNRCDRRDDEVALDEVERILLQTDGSAPTYILARTPMIIPKKSARTNDVNAGVNRGLGYTRPA